MSVFVYVVYVRDFKERGIEQKFVVGISDGEWLTSQLELQ